MKDKIKEYTDQIEALAKKINEFTEMPDMEWDYKLADHLIKLGIGDKDRFEIDHENPFYTKIESNGQEFIFSRYDIKPKEYKNQ